MDQQQNLDRLQIANSKSIKKELDKDEYIILSTKVDKFNHNDKKQSRILCLTNKNIINLLPENFARNLFSLSRIKRKIPYSKIGAITVSRHSFEFVIHIPSEYDYRFQSNDFREQILIEICRAYTQRVQNKLAFYYKDDLMLVAYTTTKFDNKSVNKMPDEKPQMLGPNDMKDNENAKGQSELIFTKNKTINKLSINDFDIIKILGRGAFSKVMLCRKKDNKEYYAIKSIRKQDIQEKEKQEHTIIERKLLEEVDFPFLTNLEFAFQTKEKLFFVMQFVKGGELFYHLKINIKFSEEIVQFYAAQILLAIEYLHNKDIIYRDLKPENILMQDDGYIKITDYGLAKKLQNKNELTYSFAGTPDYLAPEIITCKGHSKAVDFWGLGILIYEMLIGISPFYHQNHNIMFEKIQFNEIQFPNDIEISQQTKDLIQKLLQKDPKQRLSNIPLIKQHSFFSNINFQDVLNKKIKPSYLPKPIQQIDTNEEDDSTNDENNNSASNGGVKWTNNFQDEFQGMQFIQHKTDDEVIEK